MSAGRPDDTIVAAATALARSALAIVRIDGPDSLRILETLSQRTAFTTRVATHTSLRKSDGTALDDAIAITFPAPASFTGNDLVELTLHGSPAIVRRVIREVINLGGRSAEPGEFTERAVLNGKLDLVQAEAVAELINSRTDLQAQLFLGNLEGDLSRRADTLRKGLVGIVARLEASLDFSEEGYTFIEDGELIGLLDGTTAEVSSILATHRRGAATSGGLSAVILGRPNSGKSTLLNRLVGSDRAIVTPVAGTTRDIIRETLEIGGLPVTLADTAGLRESDDPIEQIGIARARDAGGAAELILYLVDSSTGLTDEDRRELSVWKNARVIYTKTDLAPSPAGECGVSVLTGEGIDELMRQLDEQVRDEFVASPGSVVNERQRLALENCLEGLSDARRSVVSGNEEEVVLVDLYRATSALGSLTGAILNEEILREIFSSFCIGK